jgi:hypothetical protein
MLEFAVNGRMLAERLEVTRTPGYIIRSDVMGRRADRIASQGALSKRVSETLWNKFVRGDKLRDLAGGLCKMPFSSYATRFDPFSTLSSKGRENISQSPCSTSTKQAQCSSDGLDPSIRPRGIKELLLLEAPHSPFYCYFRPTISLSFH